MTESGFAAYPLEGMKSKEFRARLTSKNQLTLPAGVSRLLHVGPGDSVRFEVTKDGVVVAPVPIRERLAPLVGCRRRGAGKTRREIDAEVRKLRGLRDE
ncbi:MAG: AbrB/MazE/SpoVT family DNA-binding domain-containing protein [Vulcanimicrobiaceae bacterium]